MEKRKKYLTHFKQRISKRDKNIINDWQNADGSKEAFALAVHKKHKCSMATVKKVILIYEKNTVTS